MGYVCQANANAVLTELRKHPLYRRYPDLETAKSIRIGVFNIFNNNFYYSSY